MKKQFLLNPDGTIPNNVDIDILKENDIVFVLPTNKPNPPSGYKTVEDIPYQQKDGNYIQTWKFVPITINNSRLRNYAEERILAYRNESDNLFFMEQRGELEPGTWISKVLEIKTRYPKDSI